MSSHSGVQSVVNQARGTGAGGRIGRALRVGSVRTVLCARCKALAVRTPPPHSQDMQWYRCQRVGCGHVFTPDDLSNRGRDS